MNTNLSEQIASETFEYGNHEITVKIKVTHGYRSDVCTTILNTKDGEHFYRIVEIEAVNPNDESQTVSNKTAVAMDLDPIIKKETTFIFVTNTKEIEPKIHSVEEQINATVKPVLDTLDSFYRFTQKDATIDIEVALENVSTHTSWVDVEEKTEEITSELEQLTE